jgi:hypothetical protein
MNCGTDTFILKRGPKSANNIVDNLKLNDKIVVIGYFRDFTFLAFAL